MPSRTSGTKSNFMTGRRGKPPSLAQSTMCCFGLRQTSKKKPFLLDPPDYLSTAPAEKYPPNTVEFFNTTPVEIRTKVAPLGDRDDDDCISPYSQEQDEVEEGVEEEVDVKEVAVTQEDTLGNISDLQPGTWNTVARTPFSTRTAFGAIGADLAVGPVAKVRDKDAIIQELWIQNQDNQGSGHGRLSFIQQLPSLPSLRPVMIRDRYNGATYRRGKLLGKGGFARCYELTDVITNHLYAGKIICKTRLCKPQQKEKILREVELHRGLHHAHVVDFHSFFEDNLNMYIILEICSRKSLIHILKLRKTLTEPEVRYYMRQLVDGCHYVHSQHIVHRDLKLGNMLLNEQMQLKIADFGLATKIEYEGEKKMTVCGTPNYIAPEVLGRRGHSYEADVWALGCIMYALLCGQPPFETSTLRETYVRITNNQYRVPGYVSPPAKELIVRLLYPDPETRPTLDQILYHDFFTCGYAPLSLSTACCDSAPWFPAHILPARKYYSYTAPTSSPYEEATAIADTLRNETEKLFRRRASSLRRTLDKENLLPTQQQPVVRSSLRTVRRVTKDLADINPTDAQHPAQTLRVLESRAPQSPVPGVSISELTEPHELQPIAKRAPVTLLNTRSPICVETIVKEGQQQQQQLQKQQQQHQQQQQRQEPHEQKVIRHSEDHENNDDDEDDDVLGWRGKEIMKRRSVRRTVSAALPTTRTKLKSTMSETAYDRKDLYLRTAVHSQSQNTATSRPISAEIHDERWRPIVNQSGSIVESRVDQWRPAIGPSPRSLQEPFMCQSYQQRSKEAEIRLTEPYVAESYRPETEQQQLKQQQQQLLDQKQLKQQQEQVLQQQQQQRQQQQQHLEAQRQPQKQRQQLLESQNQHQKQQIKQRRSATKQQLLQQNDEQFYWLLSEKSADVVNEEKAIILFKEKTIRGSYCTTSGDDEYYDEDEDDGREGERRERRGIRGTRKRRSKKGMLRKTGLDEKIGLRSDLNYAEKIIAEEKACSAVRLYTMLTTCLELMPAEDSFPTPVTPGRSSLVWVDKWVDYSNKYGFGFQFTDKNVGLLYNDTTRMVLSADKKTVVYNDLSNHTYVYTVDSYPESLRKKVTLLLVFSHYMDDHLIQGSSLPHPHPTLSPYPSSPSSPGGLTISTAVFVKKWFRTDRAIVIHLNNGTLQLNFLEDHTKLILSLDGQDYLVTYINSERQQISYRLLQLQHFGCSSDIAQCLRYAWRMLEGVINLGGETV